MRKTRVFVSSTCYDLGAVRENIREVIKEMGHEPVLSEYPSFPVDPLQSAISNCRKNVSENTDVFLLMIGDQYGTVDKLTGKSITNLEFQTAMNEGIPAFIFIKKSILTYLPLWKANPEIVIPGVPNNDVFVFVNEIRSMNLWTHEFERIEDIKLALNDQLSIMFRDLLERRSAGKIDPLLSFRGESVVARSLALDKPKYWEYLLSSELFRVRLSKTMLRYKRLQEGFTHVPLRSISGRDFFTWMQDYFANLLSITSALGKQFTITLKESFGPPGVPGDPNAILIAVNEIDLLLNQLIECERELIAHRPPDLFKVLQGTGAGIIDVVFETFKSLPDRLVEPFRNGDPPKGAVIDLMLVFPSPDTSRYEAELERLEAIILADPKQTNLWQ